MNINCYQIVIFILLVLDFVKSWDIAITSGNDIEFYENGTKINWHKGEEFFDLVGVTYDAFNKRMFLVDYNKNSAAAIYSLGIKSRKVSLITSQRGFIHDLSYDPNTDKIFWTNIKTKGIYFKPLSANNKVRMVFMDFEQNVTPVSIAIDSCRGYVYWTQWATVFSIQRARMDGTNREIVVDDDLHFPNALVVDQRFKKLYWVDTTEDDHYYISSSDLEGNHRQILLSGYKNIPIDMSLSYHSLFWVDESAKHIWKVRKEKDQIPFIYREIQKGNAIYAHYTIDEQTRGVPECKELRELYRQMTTEIEAEYEQRMRWKNIEQPPKSAPSHEGLDEREDIRHLGESDDDGMGWTKAREMSMTSKNEKDYDNHFHSQANINDKIEWSNEGKGRHRYDKAEELIYDNDVKGNDDFIEYNTDNHYKKPRKHYDSHYHPSKEDINELLPSAYNYRKGKKEPKWYSAQFKKNDRINDGHYHKPKNSYSKPNLDSENEWSKRSEPRRSQDRERSTTYNALPTKQHTQHSRQADHSESDKSESVKKSHANRLNFSRTLYLLMLIVITSNIFM